MKGTPETPQCGFSRTSIQILGLQGVDPRKFTAFNVLEDEELRSGESFAESHRQGKTSDNFVTTGIKEYSDWPTIPQLYVDKEFVGGCDILINMHKDGSLADMLAQKHVIVEDDAPEGGNPGETEAEKSKPQPGERSKDDVEGEKAEAARMQTEQSTGGRSKDAKGESS
jgi:glutaredoxin-related protein